MSSASPGGHVAVSSQAGRAAAHTRRRLHRRHCRPPGGLGPLLEVFGPEHVVARDARSMQPRFLWGFGSAPHAPERWLSSLLVGPYQCEHASHVACNRVGRRHTAGRFGRQGVWRSCGSSRPPRADTCCLAKRKCSLQKRLFHAARVAEVRLPCFRAPCCARALLSLSAEFLTGYTALKVSFKLCAAVRNGLNLLWCQGPWKQA